MPAPGASFPLPDMESAMPSPTPAGILTLISLPSKSSLSCLLREAACPAFVRRHRSLSR